MNISDINKAEALKMVADLAKASVRSYNFANGHIRAKNAYHEEIKAARKVYEALSSEPITEDELNEALGY